MPAKNKQTKIESCKFLTKSYNKLLQEQTDKTYEAKDHVSTCQYSQKQQDVLQYLGFNWRWWLFPAQESTLTESS